MTDGEAFIRAICRNPEDEHVRLVYADWLQRDGCSLEECQRGDFIRVQCELARWDDGLPRQDIITLDDGRRYEFKPTAELRCRERELLQQHVKDWLPILGYVWWLEGDHACVGGTIQRPTDAKPHYSCTFRRGFVEEIADVTLEFWIGTECPQCGGDGRVDRGLIRDSLCGRCHGLGRTNAHGPEIVKAAPIREVRFTDPYEAAIPEFIGYPGPLGAIAGTEALARQRASERSITWARNIAFPVTTCQKSSPSA